MAPKACFGGARDSDLLYTTSKKNSFRCLILNKKEIGVKLEKGIIVSSKTMYSDQIFVGTRCIKNIM
jgi:hypothetical protein